MKTKAELDQGILDISMTINKEFPELSKYIDEMNLKIKGTVGGEINAQDLLTYQDSLEAMVEKYAETHLRENNAEAQTNTSGYPLYPSSEDIYNQGVHEMELNPDDLTAIKAPSEEEELRNEKDFSEDFSGDDLDVPGSELDDQQEDIGSEDEENNYYSLGGDNHDDLEEDKG